MEDLVVNPVVEPEIPDKLCFRIGEVAKLAGVKPHVLRFWEAEFRGLGPKKSGTGHRVYRRKDVAFVLEIKRLLYEKRFTIEGARKYLESQGKREAVPVTNGRKQGELFTVSTGFLRSTEGVGGVSRTAAGSTRQESPFRLEEGCLKLTFPVVPLRSRAASWLAAFLDDPAARDVNWSPTEASIRNTLRVPDRWCPRSCNEGWAARELAPLPVERFCSSVKRLKPPGCRSGVHAERFCG